MDPEHPGQDDLSSQTIDPAASRRPDKVAAIGCMTLGVLIFGGVLFMLWDLVTGCSDPRHGCGYVIYGSPILILLALLCAGAGYWLYPRHSRDSDRDQPSNER